MEAAATFKALRQSIYIYIYAPTRTPNYCLISWHVNDSSWEKMRPLLPLCLSISLSLYFFIPLPLYVCISLSQSLFGSICVSESLCVALSNVCECVSVGTNISASVCVFVSVLVFVSIYLYLIMYASLFSDVALENVQDILSKTRPLTSITNAWDRGSKLSV